MATNYDRVPTWIRKDVADKYARWVQEGRSDNEIWNLIQSLVLEAYSAGKQDGEWLADDDVSGNIGFGLKMR